MSSTDDPLSAAEDELNQPSPSLESADQRHAGWPTLSGDQREQLAQDLIRSRYEYILKQIGIVDENVYRFLAFYQALMTVLVGGQILLLVNHKHWSISAHYAKLGLFGILILETIVAVFASLSILVGLWNWLDYRHDECDISDVILGEGFRKRPTGSNWYRWYETYVVLFIVVSLAAIWVFVIAYMFPAI